MMFSTTKPGLLKSFCFGFSNVRLALPVVFVLAAVTLVSGQTQAGAAASAPTKPNEQPAKAVKPAFTLRITTEGIIGLSLKAEDVKLSEIAAELSKKLKIPVVVSTIMQKQRVTTNFSDLVLEPALQMLAPQVYIDYEIDSTPGIPARPLGIYFQGYNERPPADTAVVRGTSDVMVIEGNTEDVPEKKDEEEGELKVTYEKGELSVKSKKQPLVVVLYGIANELGIPLEVKNEVLDLVTINIQKSSVESVLQQLGSNIRLYVRADLQLQQRRPLRMVLVVPEKKS
jgi:type II secretory pathway component GspD/PulD (secretin)